MSLTKERIKEAVGRWPAGSDEWLLALEGLLKEQRAYQYECAKKHGTKSALYKCAICQADMLQFVIEGTFNKP